MKVPDDSIPISELGEVAICERRVYLKRKYGARTSAQREARLDRGNMVHKAAFDQRNPEVSGSDRRCFIASAVFGPDSAMLARWCDRSPTFRGAMRSALLAIIRLTGGGR
jgi:hypothetical protein